MDIDQLRTFLAVIDHGSFSRAAEELHVGQSTVSFHVKALETSAGTRLLDRGGGSVRPTAAGAALRRYAQKIVGLRDEAVARLRAEETGEVGRLALAASTIPAEYLLPPVLASFLEAHPRVAISVEVSDSRRALERLLARDCDLALVGSRTRDRRLVFAPFAEDEVILVRPADSEAPRRGRGAPDLRRARLILREDGSGTRHAVAAFLARHAAQEPDLPRLQVGSTEAVRRCVLAGVGWGLLSRLAVTEDLAAGRLVQAAAPGVPVRRKFHAARLRAASPSAAARLFLRELHQHHR